MAVLRAVPEGPGADSAGNGTNCGSFKAADEMFPVDATVQATFNALYDTWLHNPTLANTAKVTKVGPLPNDTNGLPFDARYVAFDYPQGSYVRFYNTVNGLISTKASANALAPDLGAYIYSWSVASVNVGALLGAEPGVTFGLSWDRTSATHFEWCVPPDLDCVEFTITRAANGTVTLTYLGVLDFDQNYYPSRNGDPPGDQNSQNFPHHGGDHFDEGCSTAAFRRRRCRSVASRRTLFR